MKARTQPFSGQTALVTGASKGIGAATALALGKAGAHVVLTARTAKGLEAIEDAIHEAGGTATIAPLDLGEPDGIARLAVAMAERWDKLDILGPVGCLPAPPRPGDAVRSQGLQPGDDHQPAVDAGADRVVRSVAQAQRGRTGDRAAPVPSSPARAPTGAAMRATKAAFEVLLETYRQEVERIAKIRVAIVDPGAVRTEMRARAFPGEDPMTRQAARSGRRIAVSRCCGRTSRAVTANASTPINHVSEHLA